MTEQTVSILGTPYTVTIATPEEDKRVADCSGRANFDRKLIVVKKQPFPQVTIRHEIIHAYLYESGFDTEGHGCEHWHQNEEMVDWFAVQWPKMQKTMREVKAL